MSASPQIRTGPVSLRARGTRHERRPGPATAFAELERRLAAALATYSNVHRGAGHHSQITTELFERSREVVLDELGLDPARHVVVFCSPRRAALLQAELAPGSYRIVSSRTVGLPIGLRALAVERRALPRGVPFETGGGVVELVLPGSVTWAEAPHRFEAGTPPVVNAIALAIALQLRRQLGERCFEQEKHRARSAAELLRDDVLSGSSGLELLAELQGQRLGRDLAVPTSEGWRPFVNLDHAASTPTFWPVFEVVTETWRQPERVRADLVREVKAILAAFLDASPASYEVIFTSNTTEALNAAARLVAAERERGPGGVVLDTLLEHNSNELPWRFMAGTQLLRLSVDSRGFVSLSELEQLLRQRNRQGGAGRDRIGLVAISGCSNVLGTCNDIPAISRLVHRHGARLLVDAAQLVAHRAVQMDAWGVDYLALSAHKAYAPFGTGALLVRKEHVRIARAELDQLEGSGEENVAGIAALGKALVLLQRIGMPVIEAREKALLGRLLRGLSGIDEAEVFGASGPAREGRSDRGAVVAFCLRGVPHNLVAKRLAEDGGIGVRNGCFCAHLLLQQLLDIRRARALLARVGMRLLPGPTRALLPGLVRVSLGLENDEADVDRLLGVLKTIAARPLSAFDRLLARGRNGTCVLPRTRAQAEMEAFVEERLRRVYGR